MESWLEKGSASEAAKASSRISTVRTAVLAVLVAQPFTRMTSALAENRDRNPRSSDFRVYPEDGVRGPSLPGPRVLK